MTHTFAKGDKGVSPRWGKGKVVGYTASKNIKVQFADILYIYRPDGSPIPGSEHSGPITLRAPKRPWHDMSEPAPHIDNVQVKLADGSKRYGWYEGSWWIMGKGVDESRVMDRLYEFKSNEAEEGEIIAWRPLKAKPAKVEPAAPEPERVPFKKGDVVWVKGVIEQTEFTSTITGGRSVRVDLMDGEPICRAAVEYTKLAE